MNTTDRLSFVRNNPFIKKDIETVTTRRSTSSPASPAAIDISQRQYQHHISSNGLVPTVVVYRHHHSRIENDQQSNAGTTSDIEYGPGIVKKLREKFSQLANSVSQTAQISQHSRRKRYPSADDLLSADEAVQHSSRVADINELNREHSKSIGSLIDGDDDDAGLQSSEINQHTDSSINNASIVAVVSPMPTDTVDGGVESSTLEPISLLRQKFEQHSASSPKQKHRISSSAAFTIKPTAIQYGRKTRSVSGMEHEPEFIKLSRKLRHVPVRNDVSANDGDELQSLPKVANRSVDYVRASSFDAIGDSDRNSEDRMSPGIKTATVIGIVQQSDNSHQPTILEANDYSTPLSRMHKSYGSEADDTNYIRYSSVNDRGPPRPVNVLEMLSSKGVKVQSTLPPADPTLTPSSKLDRNRLTHRDDFSDQSPPPEEPKPTPLLNDGELTFSDNSATYQNSSLSLKLLPVSNDDSAIGEMRDLLDKFSTIREHTSFGLASPPLPTSAPPPLVTLPVDMTAADNGNLLFVIDNELQQRHHQHHIGGGRVSPPPTILSHHKMASAIIADKQDDDDEEASSVILISSRPIGENNNDVNSSSVNRDVNHATTASVNKSTSKQQPAIAIVEPTFVHQLQSLTTHEEHSTAINGTDDASKRKSLTSQFLEKQQKNQQLPNGHLATTTTTTSQQNDNGKRLPISNNDDNSSPISPSVIILNGSTTTANSRSSSSKSSPPGYVDFKENLSPGQLSSAFESVDDDNSPSSVDIPSSAFVDQLLIAGDGNPVRHSLISLVLEEDVPLLLEAMAEQFNFIFEDLNQQMSRPRSGSNLVRPECRRDKKNSGVGITFVANPPQVFAYLDENAMIEQAQWIDGVSISFDEYERICHAEREEYANQRLDLLKWQASIFTDNLSGTSNSSGNHSNGGLTAFVPSQLSSNEYSLGVTNRFSYGGDSTIKSTDSSSLNNIKITARPSSVDNTNGDSNIDLINVRPIDSGSFSRSENANDLLF